FFFCNVVIIKCLKIEQNYNACFDGKAPAVGCPAKVKINGFEMMAINLQNQSASNINPTPCFGLINKDQKVGISTIVEKLESMYPHYHSMNKLMHKLTTKRQHHPLLSLLEMRLEAVTWKAKMILYVFTQLLVSIGGELLSHFSLDFSI
ncbi:hypothetical protein VP01_10608g1, partial [Puccinia sorghi]